MPAITRAQREAIKKIFNRGPVFKSDKTSPELAQAAGWRFVETATLPEEIRSRVSNPERHSYIWIHGKVTPLYAEADDIVKDYRLADQMRYREFRKTVLAGFDCLMVKWQGMWLGIEKDGYTHS